MKNFFKGVQYESLSFATTTILNWEMLFLNHNLAKIVLDSINFGILDKRWQIFFYVLMPNHLHFISQILRPYDISDLMRNFHKFTSQQIIWYLKQNNPQLLKKFFVNKADRKYQIWQREPVIKNITTEEFLEQKVEYIHGNPLQPRWRDIFKIDDPCKYEYYSARFCYQGVKDKYIDLADGVLVT